MAGEMVMLNVRMERELREAGNAVLAELGVSPSAFVRAMWELLAGDRVKAEREVAAIMKPERTPERQAEIDRKKAALERGSHLFETLAEALELDPATFVPLTDEEEREARYEYLNEKYGAQDHAEPTA